MGEQNVHKINPNSANVTSYSPLEFMGLDEVDPFVFNIFGKFYSLEIAKELELETRSKKPIDRIRNMITL
jgi:hypothetical protein